MNKLLQRLRKLNESLDINIDTFITACNLSTYFMALADELNEQIQDGESPRLEPTEFEYEDIYKLANQYVYICTSEQFKNILNESLDRMIKDIPYAIQPYINKNISNNILTDKALRRALLDYLDIYRFDEVRVDNVEYIIFE